MSQTYSIICRETKQRVWIGQGDKENIISYYYGSPVVMENLLGLLNSTIGKKLEAVCNNTNEEVYDFEEFTCRHGESMKKDEEIRENEYVVDMKEFEGRDLSLILARVSEWVKENKALTVTCVFDADTANWVVDVAFRK
jgi:hypothetical protein